MVRVLHHRWIVGLSVAGFVAALLFAFGPVDQGEFQYSLRPAETSEERVIIAPLAVARSEPDRLLVTMPCGEAGSGFSSARDPGEFVLFADAVQPSPFELPELSDGVRLAVGLGEVTAWLGDQVVTAVSVDQSQPCVASLSYQDGLWELSAQRDSGSAVAPGPRFSEARFTGPAASDPVSGVSVWTRELGTSPSGLQVPFFLLALVLAIGSMWAITKAVSTRTTSVMGGHRWSVRSFVRSVTAVDVAVVAALAGWLVLLPPQFDEGWNRSITGSYDAHGDFFGLYTNGAGPSPLGYWLWWVQGLWVSATDAPVLMRLFPLGVGVGTWAGLRSIGRSYGIPGSGGSLWVMSAVYVVGFGAFGMTLRAEPIVMALLTASVAIAVRFHQDPRGGLLTAWVFVVALALLGHTSGVVVLAPAVLSGRRIWSWLKSSRSGTVFGLVHGLGLASIMVLLAFVDSNVQSKLDSIRVVRSDGQHGFGLLDEDLRYRFLDAFGPTMHRLVVVLMVVAVGALIMRRRPRDLDAEFPARALAVGLVLLALTPSKWFWHFGGLVPIAALAVAIELRAAQRWRQVVVLAGTVAALPWVWSDALPWAVLDLRTQRWWSGATNFLPADLAAPATWLGIAGVVWALVYLLKRWRPTVAAWTPVEATVLLAAGLVVAVTAVTFVLDIGRTDGWTYGRQSLRELVGSGDCGLGEEIRVPAPGSVDRAALSGDRTFDAAAFEDSISVGALAEQGSVDIMVTPELMQYFPCVDPPRIVGGVAQIPDVMVLTPVIAWQTTFVSAALSDDYYRIPVPIPPSGDDGRLIIIVSHEFLTGAPARATHQFEIDSG